MTGAGFAGKAALVTGAGSGIGEAVARALAGAGAAVAVVDSDERAAGRVVAHLEQDGARVVPVITDVRDFGAVADAVRRCVDELGGIDVLVNSAAVVRYADVTELTEDDWDRQIDTNVKGVYNVCHHAIPAMRRRGGGAIVNLSSAQALASQALVVAYAASKAAILSMTRTMAIDHAKDRIRVNCVLPGSVRTAMLHLAAELFSPGDADRAIDTWGEAHPIGRVIEPVEVARVVLFLAGDDASAVTGAAWQVDGGLTARLAV